MFGRDPWGGSLEIHASDATDYEASQHTEREARARTPHLEETQQSWLLAPSQHKKNKKHVNLGCLTVSRTIFIWTVSVIAFFAILIAAVVVIVKTVPRRHPPAPSPDNYIQALHKALMFFNAQKSGKLPKDNNVTWRGNSCEGDGIPDTIYKNLEGGYYDAGDTIKFHFPQAFAMTMLSWSVIEYRPKYESAGEIKHVLEIIRWGMDYFLKTFNSSSTSINTLISQVGSGVKTTDSPNDHSCWMRPEDIDYKRPVVSCSTCSDLACEMAAALAAGSIVFKSEREYSNKLVNGAKSLYSFGRRQRGRYSGRGSESALFYNSTSYWDEFVWGGAWMYYATGNLSYLDLVTKPAMARHAGAFWGGPDYGVFSWDSKLPGAQVLLSRMRLFLSPGYPYEDILSTFHTQTGNTMCSFLPDYKRFKRTPGGMIQLNHGRSQPLQYVVNAAYLASLFSDYLESAGVPGWYCGPKFYHLEALRDFARSQLDYILGDNPLKLSYVVGWGPKFPQQVHHRGASIPSNERSTCTGGLKWRDSKKPNPNVVIGAMVAGPDTRDAFRDVRAEYNYTEPTLAGNAGLVAALVASGGEGGLDRNGIFSAVPRMYPFQPPPPVPWKP